MLNCTLSPIANPVTVAVAKAPLDTVRLKAPALTASQPAEAKALRVDTIANVAETAAARTIENFALRKNA